MTDARKIQAGPPPQIHRYRVIRRRQTPEACAFKPILVSEDHVLQPNERNAFPDDLSVFGENLDWEVEQSVDPDYYFVSDALFITTDQPLGMAGIEKGYQFPVCPAGGILQRIVLEEKEGGIYGRKLPPDALIPPLWRDPQPSEIEGIQSFLSLSEEVFLCERFVSDDSHSIGLFLYDGSSKERTDHGITEGEWLELEHEALYSDAIKDGGVVADVVREYIFLQGVRAPLARTLFHVALQLQFFPVVVIETLDQLAVTSRDADDFAYRGIAILSLYILKKQCERWVSKQHPGLPDDIPHFVETMSSLIHHGWLRIRSARPCDPKLHFTGGYDHENGEIVVWSGCSPEMIVHEFYHAYQDIMLREQTLGESEYEAYRIGRIMRWAESARVDAADLPLALWDEIDTSHECCRLEESFEPCGGDGRSCFASIQDDLMQNAACNRKRFTMAVFRSLFVGAEGAAVEERFFTYYKFNKLLHRMRMIADWIDIPSQKDLALLDPDERDRYFNALLTKIKARRRIEQLTKELREMGHTPTSGTSYGEALLEDYVSLILTAGPFKPELSRQVQRWLIDDADLIGAALLSQPAKGDGL